MNHLPGTGLLIAAVLAFAAPVAAQDPPAPAETPPEAGEIRAGSAWAGMPMTRSGVFSLSRNDLIITVDADVPGVIQVLRGSRGHVTVQARSDGGLPGFAMSDRGGPRLTLSGAGAGSLAFIVVVPERARVTVRMPGQAIATSVGTLARSATFEWPVDPDGIR